MYPPPTHTHADSLSSSIKKTFKDYETTLKNQTTHIEELKRENEVAVAQNEELTQQCSDLELRMSRACAAKEALSSRVEELTNSLDGTYYHSGFFSILSTQCMHVQGLLDVGWSGGLSASHHLHEQFHETFK